MSLDDHDLDDLLGRAAKLIEAVEASVAAGEIDASAAAEVRDEVADLVEAIAAIVDEAEDRAGNRRDSGGGKAPPEYLALAEEASGASEPGVDTSPASLAAAANQTTEDVSYRELVADVTGAGEGDNPALRDAGTAGRNDASREAYRAVAEADEDTGAATDDLEDYEDLVAEMRGADRDSSRNEGA